MNTATHLSLDIGVKGMTCASCVGRVERALKKVPGVAACLQSGSEHPLARDRWQRRGAAELSDRQPALDGRTRRRLARAGGGGSQAAR